MLIQFVYVFVVVALMLVMLGLFVYKAGLQLQYLRLQSKKPAGSVSDIIQFDYSNASERKSRLQAFLLFPLMYPIDIEEDEAEELKKLKLRIKKIHIGIYSLLILVIILAVYSEKVFPQSA
jgi:hypothetical protein